MISERLKSYAKERYAFRLSLLGMCRQEVKRRMVECTEEEQVLMQFLYGTMPLRDVGEYDFSMFLGFVRHSLMLRETMEWCRDIPEEIFLHYILYPRINTEAMEHCRPFFYRQLIERIKGMPTREAVLEINYWCAEHAAYALTDDRTVSPMTVYRSGNGRCGEESTFAVTAFRSVGIPARQVYTPRWAHCDDNHAWVEVYVEGKWHFLGACEPEEVLDRGWFTHASSRALLIHTRTFSDYPASQDEECLGRDGLLNVYNQTAAYAWTKYYEIVVLNGCLCPVSEARVSIEILNMAEYSSVAHICTDHEGKAVLTLGLGDIHLVAEKNGRWAEMITSVKHTERAVLILRENGLGLKEVWADMDMEAPAASPIHTTHLTREQHKRNRARLSMVNQIRERRLKACFREEQAAVYPKVRTMLYAAGGNFPELYSFLSKDNNPDRQALLSVLSIKDAKDAKAEILESHMYHAARFRQLWEKRGQLELYYHYILCPRIFLEELSDYRGFIQGYFFEEEQQKFRENPEKIWTFIQSSIRYHADEDYNSLISSPSGCLRLLWGNLISQKILFVAICRTLGIPARINPVNQEAEWMNDGRFISVGNKQRTVPAQVFGVNMSRFIGQCSEDQTTRSPQPCKIDFPQPAADNLASAGENGDKDIQVLSETGEVKLLGGEDSWKYYQNWTLGKLQEGYFITLDYTGVSFSGNTLTLTLNEGTYRLLTSARLPNGNQKASEYLFDLHPGEKKQISMRLRAGKPEDMLTDNQMDDFPIMLQTGEVLSAASLLKEKTNMLIFLTPGEEPSEHVLNELLARKKELWTLKPKLVIVLPDKEEIKNPTLRQVLQEIPRIQTAHTDMEAIAEPLARQLYVEPDKFPLLVLTVPGLKAVYACSGYNVGSVDLVIKLISLLKQ